MCKAVELSTAGKLQRSSKEEMKAVKELQEELLEVEDSAVSHFRDGFQNLFQSLTEDRVVSQGPEWVPAHQPHHDAESLF